MLSLFINDNLRIEFQALLIIVKVETKSHKLVHFFVFLFAAKVKSFQSAVLCLALIIGGSGFHNNAIAVNPSDLAPKHSGSVFGLMNTVGAIPGMFNQYNQLH